jgi:hypothetical protein
MPFFDICRRKVQCMTCKEYYYKRDCNTYRYETWAGDLNEYECKVCDVTRKLEGQSLMTHGKRVEEILKNHPVPSGMI